MPFLLHEFLRLQAEKLPEREALISEERRVTFGEMDQITDRLALGLLESGLRRLDRVVIFGDNSWEIVAAVYGILKAGGVFVILNGGMKAPKLRYILEDCGAAFLFSQVAKAPVVREALQTLRRPLPVIWMGPPAGIPQGLGSVSHRWADLISNGGMEDPSACRGELTRKAPRNIDCDLAALIYTSGSTGEPKGVMAPHRSMLAAAHSIIQYLENRPEDIILNALPLSFDYGLYQVLMAFIYGGRVVLERSFAYPVKILERMQKERVTGFPIVPTMGAMLLKMRNIDQFDLSPLRYLTNTAAALPVEHIRRLGKLFPQCRFYSMYGLTECKRVSFLPPEELDSRSASVGKAIPNCEVLVVDEQGREVPPGEVGELVIRGSNVMSGYWRAPEQTARTFREGRHSGERLLYSGDLFKKDDDGYLYFMGRNDDMIKTRGERVSPKEVENVLCLIPGVNEAAVVGLADEILGQVVKAFVVLRDGRTISEKEIMKFCTEHLEPFMVPRYVEFLGELPKTPNAKVDRKALQRG